MSQFTFLTPEFPEIFTHAAKAETHAQSDPRAACLYARITLETIVNWLYTHDASLRDPFEKTLAARIYEPSFRALMGQMLVAKARIVKDLGNAAAHETKTVPVNNALTAVRELFHIAYWLTRTYACGPKPHADLTFSAEALPRTTNIPVASLATLNEIANNFLAATQARDDAERQRLASDTERAKLEAEINALRAEIAAVKTANAAVTDTHDYNETQTRKSFIDLLLHEAGWALDQARDIEYPVTGMPNATGEGFVDYVLWGDDGKPLGLVEAKRTGRDAREGRQQAKLYADCLETRFAQRPIIFYSNGYEHWIWDDAGDPPRQVQGFLTKDELQLAIRRRTTRKPLAQVPIDHTIVERSYQHRAISRVSEAFERDHLRKALLVMATGSGKTRTVIALADMLTRANWVKRTLFLADRKALVTQAVNAFKRFSPSSSPVNLVTEKDAQGRVYVSTYQTMMGLIDEMNQGERRFGTGHFDLIIIDEAHRSIYRKYASIFAYFDSLLVGLTATPKDEIDRDTYRLFDLQKGVPTDAYGLDEAVEHGYLVPPQPVSVPIRFMRQGISYADLNDEEKEQWDALEWSDEDDPPPDRVDPPNFNTWLFNADTADKALEHLMTHGLRVAAGERIGKTIVFAKNHNHAQFIVDRFDVNYPHLKGSFTRVIDFKTEYAQSLIDDFSQPEKPPHIAVSVDMLDTGIDVPEVLNLIFFKMVRSKTKFWQMIGRGTRLCPDIFGPGEDKRFFYVFDFCQNFEFFNQNPQTTDAPIADSLGKRLFTGRTELVGELYDLHLRGGENEMLRALRHDTSEHLREEIRAMNLVNFIVRPKRRFVEKYAQTQPWEKPDLDARTELIEEVSGLPSALTDNDVEAKQFDMLILRTQLAILRSDASFKKLHEKITAAAVLLETLAHVPMVAPEIALIQEIQTEAYWEDITVPMLEIVRRRLRSLIKLIERKKRTLVYTDFEDEIGQGTYIEIGHISTGADMERFRAKARHFLKNNENHIAILKLRRNEPLTPTDLNELERIFTEAGVGTAEDIERIRREEGLGIFVRSLVGLDRIAAAQAFDTFIRNRKLTADQSEFIRILINHLTARGIVEPGLLYESPFTDINPNGVSGIFTNAEVLEVVDILAEIRRRAAA